MTDMNDLFADAPILTPDERFAAAFAVEDEDFDEVHRLMAEHLPDFEDHDEADCNADLFEE